MASKQGYSTDFKNYLDKRLELRLNGNRVVTGKFRGYDPFMNVVLEDCFETITKKDKTTDKVDIGTVMIRGNSIILWQCLDKIANKQ